MRLVIKVGTGKILGRESLRAMWTVQRSPEPEAVFGLGWEARWKDKMMAGMNGVEPSTTTFFRYLPGSGAGVALLCNAEGARDLGKLLEDILEATFR